MNGLKTVAIVVVAALVSACASSKGGGAYERAQARQEMTVRLGVVESVRPVTIEGTKTPIGAGAGAAIGGIAGSTVGHGRGSTAAAILGAVGGGLAGAAIEEHATKKEGVEITVRLDNGKLIAVTQEADEVFRPGERVRVLSGGGATRVSH